MVALQRQSPGINFAGIGGETMQAAGLQPLFPMHELSVMGLVEVCGTRRPSCAGLRETADDILQKKPAVLVTIDAPDFCFRVAKRVRRRNPNIRLVHYVRPRSGRGGRGGRGKWRRFSITCWLYCHSSRPTSQRRACLHLCRPSGGGGFAYKPVRCLPSSVQNRRRPPAHPAAARQPAWRGNPAATPVSERRRQIAGGQARSFIRSAHPAASGANRAGAG